jgi:hypothetical protein
MAKILIPRSDSISAKNIVPTDFEKYFTNDIQDYVISGFSVSGSAGTNRDVDITAGTARVKGYYLELDATDTAGFTFGTDDVHYLYLTLARDGNNEPESWGYSSNTTGTTPTDSIMIAKVTTAGGDVSAVDNSLEFKKMHHQTHFVGSGNEIGTLSPTFPGMICFCTKTEGDFVADSLYVRTSDNTTWYSFSYNANYYGSGADGAATNPTIEGGNTYSYTDLTLSSTATWNTGTGPVTIKCTGTLNLTATITYQIYDTASNPTGGTGPNIASGGSGGKSLAPLFIFAKTITGTGTINMTAQNGNNGGNGGPLGPYQTATAGPDDPAIGVGFGGAITTAAAGQNGSSGYVPGLFGQGTGGGATVNYLGDILGSSTFYNARTGAGGGGGSGSRNTPGAYASNGAGGGGAGALVAKGGDGGGKTLHGFGDNCGGGAGGGGSCLAVVIADSCSAININLTAGDGGTGGNSTTGRCSPYVYGGPSGGGGGGGAAAAFIITNAAVNPVNITAVAGAAGQAGSLGMPCTQHGQAGNTKVFYVQKPIWMGIVGSGI